MRKYKSDSIKISLLPTSITLTIVFMVLKLAGIINWAWFWVVSPMWISLIFQILILIIVVLVLAIVKKGIKR